MKKSLGGVLLAFGVALMAGAAYGVLHEPAPRVLTCERSTTSPSSITCEPGNVSGAIAYVRKESGKSARDCFVLGPTWLCGGDSTAATSKVNALAAGEKTTVDLTPSKAPIGAVAFAAIFGLGMAVVAIGSIRKSSKSA